VEHILFVSRHPTRIAELTRRLSPMVIGATDLALCNLSGHCLDLAPANEPRNILCLRCGVPVVEIEDDGIGLATVDAGVGQKVFVRQALACFTNSVATSTCFLLVGIAIALVMNSAVFAAAIRAVASPSAAPSVLVREFRDRLPLATSGTSTKRIRAEPCASRTAWRSVFGGSLHIGPRTSQSLQAPATTACASRERSRYDSSSMGPGDRSRVPRCPSRRSRRKGDSEGTRE